MTSEAWESAFGCRMLALTWDAAAAQRPELVAFMQGREVSAGFIALYYYLLAEALEDACDDT